MYRDLAAGTGSTAALIARSPAAVVVQVNGVGARVAAEMLSGNAFEALGATPALGRLFGPADDEVGAPPVIVLTTAIGSSASTALPMSSDAASSSTPRQ